jgi:putative transposase
MAKTFRAACTRMGIKQSMGRAGSAPGNAVIESWHPALEPGLRGLERFATKAQARTRVAAWTGEYHRDRKHSSCGMRSPVGHEIALRAGEQHDRTAAA